MAYMKRNIAVIVALVVVLGLFFVYGKSFHPSNSAGSKLDLPSLPNAKLPAFDNVFTVTSAWGVFQDYLKAAHRHDLITVKSLSYQLSETCANPDKATDCNTLMDSVYLIAKDFKQGDFVNVASDDKQIIMSTDYMNIGEGAPKTKVVLLFVKSDQGEPLVLGIRFCYGEESDANVCVITDPAKRDADKDGWWDDIEVLFHK